MASKPQATKYLPAELASAAELSAQRAQVEAVPLLRELLDAIPSLVLVLNARRQILFANDTAVRLLGRPLDALIGARPGDAFGCLRSARPGDCGTTEFCTACGAGQALERVLNGKTSERECRICVAPAGKDLELRVRATPLRREGLELTIFAAVDQTDEKRRRFLERIFFHDVINSAGAVKAIAELLPGTPPAELPQFGRMLRESSEILLDEIIAQRELTALEHGEYQLKTAPLALKPFLETLAAVAATHPSAQSRRFFVEPGPPELTILTDRGLLLRVIGNMLKNAAEAESPGAAVTAGFEAHPDGGADIWVRNPTPMPRAVQLQIFQRSFSTKGEGRGLGTYSMRLLTERFLGGSISFSSSPGRGTEFRLRLPASLPQSR